MLGNGIDMKRQFLLITSVIVGALIILTIASNQGIHEDNIIELTPAILDEFNGSELSSKWKIRENWNGTISVSQGLLTLTDGTHKRVYSNVVSYTGNSKLTLSASILLTGYYQKFGFNVNPSESGQDSGIYFDTFCPTGFSCTDKNSTFTSDNNVIYYFIKNKTDSIVKHGEATIQNDQFHTLKIVMEEGNVSFLVDDRLLEKIQYTYEGPLTIGIWNDRPASMKVDHVLLELT